MAKKVTKDMYISEVLQLEPGLAEVLLEAGMGCLGCPSAQMESVGEAAMVHGHSADELVNKLNAYLESAK